MIKILVVGDSGCGKSTLVNLYNGNQTSVGDEDQMTDFVQRTIDINGTLLYLQIWDVANQDKGSSSLTMQFSRNASGIICVTDINDQMSLENSIFWKNNTSDKTLPCMIAANKYDLVEELEKEGQQLEDFQQEKFLNLFAKKHGFIGARRISSRYNDGPEELLKTLIDEIIERNSTLNLETGEKEFNPTALETASFRLGPIDKSSIFFQEKKSKIQYREPPKKSGCCK
ncbi:unnamed protein product [Moneuplotes crassus]|uniref:Uncharacterized protein n=1 Tax=Euplotes crassus TaxID=5936 RepID=A0AAD2CYV3_EUPCR|nr:unnamed protein product [Moneuplotes crassus]